jgi:hypothetical protein
MATYEGVGFLMRRFRLCVALCAAAALTACGGHESAPAGTPPIQSQTRESMTAYARVPVASPGVRAYPLGNGGPNSAVTTDMSIGSDGKIYFSAVPVWGSAGYPTSAGEIGSFDPSTQMQRYVTTAYAPGFIRETPTGIWVEEGGNPTGQATIDRYVSLGGGDVQLHLPWNFSGDFNNGILGGMAVSPSGRVWFGSNNNGMVGYVDPSTDDVTTYALSSPNVHWAIEPQFMTFASDGNLWVTDGFNGGVFRVIPTGKNAGSNTFFQLPEGWWSSSNPVYVQGIVQGPGGYLYTGDPSSVPGSLDYGEASSSATFKQLPLPPNADKPYVFAATATKLYYVDFATGGLGIYDYQTGKVVDLPLAPSANGGIVVDASGTPWLSCFTPIASGYGGCIESVTLSSTWRVYPSQSVTFTVGTPGIIGIGETGDSSPFLVKSSNASVCTAQIVPGFDHNIQVNPIAPGSCSLLIGDRNGRTMPMLVSVQGAATPPPAVLTSIRLLHSVRPPALPER